MFQRIRAWAIGNHYLMRGFRKVQEQQLQENVQIIADAKETRLVTLSDLADAVMRLEAVSDQLEDSIQALRKEEDDPDD